VAIAQDIFPEAIDYFLGNLGGDGDESEEDSEDDDDDAEEIDLEKPRTKKQRV
jgi:template-activating factor I